MVSSSVSYSRFQGERGNGKVSTEETERMLSGKTPNARTMYLSGRCVCYALLITHGDTLHPSVSMLQGNGMTQRKRAEGKVCVSLGHRWVLVLTQRSSKVLLWDFSPLFCRKERLNDNIECDVCIRHLFKHQSLEGFKPWFTHYFTPVFYGYMYLLGK